MAHHGQCGSVLPAHQPSRTAKQPLIDRVLDWLRTDASPGTHLLTGGVSGTLASGRWLVPQAVPTSIQPTAPPLRLPGPWCVELLLRTIGTEQGSDAAATATAPAVVVTHEADAVDVVLSITPVADDGTVAGYVAAELHERPSLSVLTPTAPEAIAQPFPKAVQAVIERATAISEARTDDGPAPEVAHG